MYETGTIGSQEKYERCGSAFSLLVAKGRAALSLLEDACWNCGLRQSNSVGKEVRRSSFVEFTRNVGRDEGRLQLVFCSCARDETR